MTTSRLCSDGGGRAPIRFGENLLSGCLVELEGGSASCAAARRAAVAALALGEEGEWRIAAYANASGETLLGQRMDEYWRRELERLSRKTSLR